ncbi:DNA-binding protein H-NS [Marinobacterium stanieri]|uniref:DNA-binding protein H-NS n=2 Tax=Marinobacterium stanieri TaxID=49186 RepID=A0A1N6NFV8_9GAMM|nr:DNA-binding protein H-NS [Marinobacterium stanieri]
MKVREIHNFSNNLMQVVEKNIFMSIIEENLFNTGTKMTDFIKTLTRKNSLRKHCNELSLAEIDKVIADLNDIRVEIEETKRREEEIELAKKEKVEQIQRLMKEAGVDLDELKKGIEPTAARKTVKAKYVIEDAEGKEHAWSGRGRTPVAFREYMDKHGISKDQLPTAD